MKIKKALFFLYNLILYIYSPFVNIYILCRLKKILREDEYKSRKKSVKKFLSNLKKLSDIDMLFHTYQYLRDPTLSKKYGLTMNYIPLFKTFFIERGGDCSVFARMAYKMLKRLGYLPELWLITEYGKLGDMIKKAHIVCIFMKEGREWIYEVKERNILKGYLENHMKGNTYVDNNGKEFKYDNIFKMRWF